MASIAFEKVSKVFPDGTRAVDGLNLEISDGEFTILVGPSGSGKSTALRMVAGLEDATHGSITIGDRVVNDVAPRDRDIAMVFQSYALYPHMSVESNMGFALRMRKQEKTSIASRVAGAGSRLGIGELMARRPKALSGGQRQRVAMGRAIVRSPQAFLMDEPLSNLDAKLRVQMRAEVSRIQDRLGTTTVYVTHDQTEAMTLGDRVAVMRAGVLQQVGAPQELYDDPNNLFVAGFIGSPAMNFMPVEIEGDRAKLPMVEIPIPAHVREAGSQGMIAGIRPEHFEDASLVGPARRGHGHTFPARIELVESMGSELYAHFDVETEGVESQELAELAQDAGTADVPGAGQGRVVARLDPASRARQGEELDLWVDTDRIHFFDAATGGRIHAQKVNAARA